MDAGLNDRISKQYRHHTRRDNKMSTEQLTALRGKLIRENRILLIKKTILMITLLTAICFFLLWLNGNVDLNKLEPWGF